MENEKLRALAKELLPYLLELTPTFLDGLKSTKANGPNKQQKPNKNTLYLP